MQREIKFRGKRADNGEWVYGYYVKGATRHCILKDLGGIQIDVIPETVGQMMAKIKKDNGEIEEIFEGDLIVHGERVLKVMFLSGNTSLVGKENKTAVLLSFNDGKVKVGNIHDNPELLTL